MFGGSIKTELNTWQRYCENTSRYPTVFQQISKSVLLGIIYSEMHLVRLLQCSFCGRYVS